MQQDSGSSDKARWHKQWLVQRPRQVWVRPTSGEPAEQPRQGRLLRWEQDHARAWWVAVVVTLASEQLRVEVVPAAAVAPVESDPNRALSRDAATLRGLRPRQGRIPS